MNRDVKIGLAIGLLLLVGLFVWFAWKASRGKPAATDVAQNQADKTLGADRTLNLTARDYFADNNTDSQTGKDNSAIVDLGNGASTPTNPKDDMTADAHKYSDMLHSGGTPALPNTHSKVKVNVPPPADANASPSTYVVKAGDTLSDISRKVYGSSKYWEKIAKANNTDPKSIRVGQTLKIPALADSEKATVHGNVAASAPVGVTDGSGAQTYKVVKGDTLQGISKKFYGTVAHAKDIQTANKLDDDHMLRVGSVLTIPKLASAEAPTATTPSDATTTPATNARKGSTVQANDTLSSISKKFYGSPKYSLLIMQANNLDDPRSVPIGMKLVIPPKPDVASVSSSAVEPSAAPGLGAGEKAYTVREGDTPAIIAASELGSSLYSDDVMKRNKLVAGATLKPGQVLVLPAQSSLRVLSTESPATR